MIKKIVIYGRELQNNSTIIMNKEDSPTLPICGGLS